MQIMHWATQLRHVRSCHNNCIVLSLGTVWIVLHKLLFKGVSPSNSSSEMQNTHEHQSTANNIQQQHKTTSITRDNKNMQRQQFTGRQANGIVDPGHKYTGKSFIGLFISLVVELPFTSLPIHVYTSLLVTNIPVYSYTSFLVYESIGTSVLGQGCKTTPSLVGQWYT